MSTLLYGKAWMIYKGVFINSVREKVYEMQERQIKKNQKIHQLEDEINALRNQIGDLQIKLEMQNSQTAEERTGIDLNWPVVLDD